MSDLSANKGSNKKKPRNNASKKAKIETLITPQEDEAFYRRILRLEKCRVRILEMR